MSCISGLKVETSAGDAGSSRHVGFGFGFDLGVRAMMDEGDSRFELGR